MQGFVQLLKILKIDQCRHCTAENALAVADGADNRKHGSPGGACDHRLRQYGGGVRVVAQDAKVFAVRNIGAPRAGVRGVQRIAVGIENAQAVEFGEM